MQAPAPMSPAQSGPFCEPITKTELNPVVGAKVDYAKRPGVRRRPVAGQADDLWESPLAFLLRESVGKSTESWHVALRPELMVGCQADAGHMVVIQLFGCKKRVRAVPLPSPTLPLHPPSRWPLA